MPAVSSTLQSPMGTPPAAGGGAGAQANTPLPDPVIERQIATAMTAGGVMRHVDALAAQPRQTGQPEFLVAAEYVVREARAAGWDARIVETHDDRLSRPLYNVVADRAGSAPPETRKLVVAGAHLDTVRSSPGANDNASGSGALLEAARVLAAHETPNDTRLLWFDGEEQGLLGSRAYVRENVQDLERAVVMLNADMVASPRGDVGFSMGATTSAGVGDAIAGVAARNGIEAVFRSERHARSDHHRFDKAGVPSAHFGVSVRTVVRDDPNYHSRRDTPDKLNLDVLEGSADLLALSIHHFGMQPGRITTPQPPRNASPITGPPL